MNTLARRAGWSLLIATTMASVSMGDTFRYKFGAPDNFQAPQELATPSVDLQLLYNSVGPPFRQYDQGGDDRHFLETIDNLPVCIDSATLVTTLKPTGSVDIGNFQRGTTDVVRLLFTSDTLSGVQVGPYWVSRIGDPNADASLLPLNWGDDNYAAGVSFFFPLGNLPLGTNNTSGSSANLIPSLEQFGHLNVEISDDTAIDHLELAVFTSLTGDINGDGTVDNGDLNLAIALDGQVPPNGVGDTNGDNIINNIDQANILSHFGETCIVPEPSTALLGVLSCASLFVMLVKGRRRT